MFGKCSECGKMFAMKRVEKKLVKKEKIEVIETLTQPNLKGEIQTMSERFVPGEVKVYEIVCKCRFCGTQKTRIKQKKRKL